MANKDEFWGLTSSSSWQLGNSSKLDCSRLLRRFVKALKPQRTYVREDLRVEGSAENRLVSHSLLLFLTPKRHAEGLEFNAYR